jgi:site-specific recombinase XerD
VWNEGQSLEASMINRDNWKQIKMYMAYLAEVKQLDEGTVTSVRSQLRHMLEWLDDTPLAKAPDVRPTFPRYVSDRLAPGSADLACGTARRFFAWLRMSNKRIGRSVTELWVTSLVSRSPGRVTQYDEYTLGEVRSLIAVPGTSQRIRRDCAAVAFLFLSGMRIGAFCTLPIEAIDIDHLTVKQWPEMGVHTKRRKSATTFLLDIPDLLDVARDWDQHVRSRLRGDSLWYAPFELNGLTLAEAKSADHSRRCHNRFDDGLRLLCGLAGVRYRSVHNLRHGFAVYGLKVARDIADMEAVSKNLMHKSLKVTLEVYAVLGQDDVKARIVNLGK